MSLCVTPHQASVQEVILCLLCTYPEPVDIMGNISTPRAVPFVQCVFPLLKEAISLQQETVLLVNAANAWRKTTWCAINAITALEEAAASDVFSNWAALRVPSMQKALAGNHIRAH